MKFILTLATILLFTGCAVQKQYQSTGGSKADGVVKLSYEYGSFEKPQINEQQGLDKAIKRCKAWGYTTAEAFDTGMRQCVNPTYNGCNVFRVTKEYQCGN